MPCDTAYVFDAQLGKCKNWDVLRKVAEENGWDVRESNDTLFIYHPDNVMIQITRGGGASISPIGRSAGFRQRASEIVKEITTAYTKRIISDAAKKWGWQIQDQSGNKLRLVRRF